MQKIRFLSVLLFLILSIGNAEIEWNFTFPIGTGPTAELSAVIVLNGEQKTSKPFAVRNDSLYAAIAPFGTLGFGHSPADSQAPSFVESLLADYADQVISFSYDNIPTAADHPGEVGLLLRFGDRQAARCSAEWLELEEARFEIDLGDWGFEIDEFSMGAYTWALGGQASVQLTSNVLTLPSAVFSRVVRVLGGHEAQGEGEKTTVACDSAEDLVFSIAGRDYRLSPVDYLDRTTQSADNQCEFKAEAIACTECFLLPVGILRDRCFLFDYSRPGVAIADRLS
ncbi:hypothetical protein M3Y99_01871400 [Aphelenchoides fujianensis]|nr:hypothetical protein M3Y99_01871400 [Aphelenchoides fujianensis]